MARDRWLADTFGDGIDGFGNSKDSVRCKGCVHITIWLTYGSVVRNRTHMWEFYGHWPSRSVGEVLRIYVLGAGAGWGRNDQLWVRCGTVVCLHYVFCIRGHCNCNTVNFAGKDLPKFCEWWFPERVDCWREVVWSANFADKSNKPLPHLVNVSMFKDSSIMNRKKNHRKNSYQFQFI